MTTFHQESRGRSDRRRYSHVAATTNAGMPTFMNPSKRNSLSVAYELFDIATTPVTANRPAVKYRTESGEKGRTAASRRSNDV